LESFNLTSAQLSQKIQAFNQSISGGTITETGLQYVVKGVSLLQQKEDFENLLIGYTSPSTNPNGEKSATYLRDVATVSFANKEPTNIVRINGERSIGLSIYKETKFNTVKAVDDLTNELEKIRKALPGYKFTIVSNQGTFIKTAVDEVKNTLLIGILLAVIVLYVFLRRIGTTLIVSLAIPISIVASFNLMYFNGLTLNIMTLGGLALGAGRLVDDAIVVMENIFRNHESGMSAKDAAVIGTAEVGGAITSSTLTTIVVFLPIVYIHGASGELFKDMAWTVAFALLSSLAVAIFLVPMLYHRFYMNKPKIEVKGIKFSNYHNFVTKILRHRWKITIVSLVLMGLSFLLVPYIGSEFMPSSESKQFSIEVKMPEGTTLERTSSAIASIEGMVKDLLGENVQSIYSLIGPSTSSTTSATSVFEGVNTAEVKVVLKPDAKYVASQVVASVASWYAENPQFEVSFKQNETALQSILGTEEAPVVVEVRGDDLQQIEKITDQVKAAIKDVPGLYNLQTNMEAGYPEVNVVVDRFKAGSYNLSVSEIVNQVTAKLKGQVAGQMDTEGELKDISIYVPKIGVTELGDMIIKNGTQVIRLYEVSKLEKAIAPKEIYHRNQNRIGKVMSEINKNVSLDKVVEDIQAKISSITLPPSYSIKVAGEEQKRQDSVANLRFALILSIVLVYMVMACQFESLLHPLIILLTIPFAIVGTIILFYIMHLTFNMMALIGIIMLGGIAVNDSIILIDRINQLRRTGMEKHAAIALGSQQRLRPILMMSIITVIALLPLTFGFGEGAALRSPMAYAVIGGMITSTLLTILVIPCVYDLMTSNKPLKEIE